MKNKFKSYAFCFGVCVAIIGLIVSVGNAFNFTVNEVALTSVVTAFLGVFVAMGIIEKEEVAQNKENVQEDGNSENIYSFENYETEEDNENNKLVMNNLSNLLQIEADDADKK